MKAYVTGPDRTMSCGSSLKAVVSQAGCGGRDTKSLETRDGQKEECEKCPFKGNCDAFPRMLAAWEEEEHRQEWLEKHPMPRY